MDAAISSGLFQDAADVLRRNDIGGWTRAAPDLYPHQWSWDSGFITIGLAHLDTRRAAEELRSLFRHQWKNGKVPHIVFNPHAPPDSYFPGPEHWVSAGLFPDAPPAPPYTSALCQPPTHAIGALKVFETARRRDRDAAVAFLREIYPKLLFWHRYLATARDPERSGLVTIYHPWESGTDNSPRWDGPLDRIPIGEVPTYTRRDVQHVSDPSHRPTDEEYDRFLWLLELLKRARYEEADIYGGHPFLVKDVLFSAILVAANEALLEIHAAVGAPAEDRATIERWIERGKEGLEDQWDPALGLCLDRDVLTGEPLRVRTVAGFAPLISGGLDGRRLADTLRTLDSPAFVGNPLLHRPLPPSTAPDEPGFHPRSYWRGPVWPVANWLLWWSLLRAGEPERASSLRHHTLEALAESGFAEYFEPFTGEPLGSGEQSWTAAIALDMLATDAAV